MEGIKLQNEEFDPGGPLFWRKKKKSEKGVPSGGVTPPHFFGINCISEKNLRKQYYICVYSFSSDFRVGVRVFRGARTPLGGRNQTVAEGVGGPGLSRGADACQFVGHTTGQDTHVLPCISPRINRKVPSGGVRGA